MIEAGATMCAIIQRICVFILLLTITEAEKAKKQVKSKSSKAYNRTKQISVPDVSKDVRESLALPPEMKCEGCRAAAYHMLVVVHSHFHML